MPDPLAVLHASVEHLQSLVEPLTPAQLEQRAYPEEWTIADVLSHLGSGAVIFQRRVEDALAGRADDEDFAPAVWDTWNAKSPAAKAADGLAANRALLETVDKLSDEERRELRVAMGPMSFDFDQFIGLRLNEQVLHTWDVEVALDPSTTLREADAGLVIDNLELMARFTAQASGSARVVGVHTTSPDRRFEIVFTDDAVELREAAAAAPDVELPAEAFIRLVYGRLDPDHTPPVESGAVLDDLRRTFPGP